MTISDDDRLFSPRQCNNKRVAPPTSPNARPQNHTESDHVPRIPSSGLRFLPVRRKSNDVPKTRTRALVFSMSNASAVGHGDAEVACSVCTLIQSAQRTTCEVCESPLPQRATQTAHQQQSGAAALAGRGRGFGGLRGLTCDEPPTDAARAGETIDISADSPAAPTADKKHECPICMENLGSEGGITVLDAWTASAGCA